MYQFPILDRSVPTFPVNDTWYFLSAEVKKAFDLTSRSTLVDKLSLQWNNAEWFDSLPPEQKAILEQLDRGILIISLADLLKVIAKESDPRLENFQDTLFKSLARLLADSLGLRSNQKLLPATTDDQRIAKMAASVASRTHGLAETPIDKISLPDWETVTEMLGRCGEDTEDETSLAKNDEFRFWINRQISDIYRAQFGEEPPTVAKKKTKAYCYPPSFRGLVSMFLGEWISRAS